MNSAAQKELSKHEYWDARYNVEGQEATADESKNYEWFRTFQKLKPFFMKHLPSPGDRPRILQLGCGTSSLSADLHGLGYTDQLSVDFSAVAIEQMQQKYHSLQLEWQVMDVRKMDIPNETIDVAIDKGTLDAMLHGSLWDPEDDVKDNVGAYVDEISRVLKYGGQWLYITYRQPHFLRPLLQRPDVWDVEVQTLEDDPGSFEYFGFVIRKRQSKVY